MARYNGCRALLLAALLSISAAQSLQDDVPALLAQLGALSNAADFLAGNNIRGWDANTPLCNASTLESGWTSVTCRDDGTYSLELGCAVDGTTGEQQGLCTPIAQGTLAPELKNARFMSKLSMFRLNITGPIPQAWSQVGAFPSLIDLDLHDLALTGTLPAEWALEGVLPSMVNFWFYNNSLSGSLPPAWGGKNALSARLRHINVVDNNMSGPLPLSWGEPGSFQALEELYLRNNLFSGTLPESWGAGNSFQKIVWLVASGNMLTGTLPAAWGSGFASLENLLLESNNLTGTLPPQWAGFPVVKQFAFSDNQLTGPLPGEWGAVSAFRGLQKMWLAGNELSGPIPDKWGADSAFPSLEFIVLDGNDQLCGPLPGKLGAADATANVFYDGATLNSTGLRPCPPPPPPLPPSPPPPPPPPPASEAASSSTPVGAIAGGVVGGVVFLAAAAFLALRCSRDRSRRNATSENATHPGQDFKGTDTLISAPPPHAPTLSDPSQLPPASVQDLPLNPMPPGYASPVAAKGSQASGPPLAAELTATGYQSASSHSVLTDPLLTFIATTLPSMSRPRVGTSASGGSSAAIGSGGSGSMGTAPSAASSVRPEVSQWLVNWDDIQMIRAVGSGSFGRVYLATWQETLVAVKVLLTREDYTQGCLELPESTMTELQEEAIVMASIRHPAVLSLLGLCIMPPCLVTEWCSRGSLYDMLRAATLSSEAAAALTWRLRLSMALDAATGLLYLHSRDIVHRDVKSPNLMVDEHYRIKVGDFSLSKILGDAHGEVATSGAPGNPMWLAPEILEGGRATKASDVYSFALVMFELLAWRLPYAGMAPFKIMKAVTTGERPQVPARELLPGPDTAGFAGLDAYCQLMRECWAQRLEDRPAFAAVVPRLRALYAELLG